MTLLASSWYENGTVWTISVGALVAIGVAGFMAWAGLRTVRPKRRLSYCLRRNTSLLNTSDAAAGTLTVTHGATDLTRPRMVEVELSNDGRMAITDRDFHNGDPITFDVGAPIVAVLSTSSLPSQHRTPVTSVGGQLLKVEPSLLSSRQTVSFSLLVNGPAAGLGCQHSLIDVPLNRREPTDVTHVGCLRQGRLMAFLISGLVLVQCVGFLLWKAHRLTDAAEEKLRQQVVQQDKGERQAQNGG
ncbi:hypothetical protein ABT224_22750 [Streptomyces sp. NPDC001584]|uniref:hypothetical protein n=1 Tax=Streptomyces sp. NPDC001584 TaxID=3154521 RepID=UPI00331A27DC